MRLLAIDSSTDWISVAAGDANAQALFEEPASNAHSERVMPLVRQALAAAGWRLRELDAIAFGAGPGAFTGVRIACAVAQGLALGVDVPVLPVGTLEAMAEETWRRHGEARVLAALDARMQEVYFAAYAHENDGWDEVTAPEVAQPDGVAVPQADWAAAGDGFVRYPALAARLCIARVLADVRPSARAIVSLAAPRVAAGEAMAAHDALPVYVRHRVALTLAERDAGVRL
ncbi:MAG TPA: tRNA (adenosine(37)-N6)-threonylcarbamoyltransferase complex dimerization subunit type 1 TsaB [Casimicrobiaceae bacterium]|nr:tRNA (adenosine(37)-N6)-threonylcarbamoyltransferase complex dimerization subunit type 1 TsaB [Casimicrobiaceae bacterium]